MHAAVVAEFLRIQDARKASDSPRLFSFWLAGLREIRV